MYDNQALPGRENHTPFNLAPVTQTATEPMLFAKTAQPTLPLSNNVLIGVPFSLLALWTIALVYFKQKTKQHTGFSTEARPKLYKRVPCRHCIFFKNNPYLKCAIRPVDALTVNAIGCTDFASPADDQRKS